MRIQYSIASISVALALCGCSNDDESAHSEAQPEWAKALSSAQEQMGMSDEEMEMAITRWLKVANVWNAAIESGIISEEELATFPSKVDELLAEQGTQDGLRAAYSLSYLASLNRNEIDEVRSSLRRAISDHYRYGRTMKDENYEAFAARAEELSDEDPELKRLLDEIKSGQQGEVGER